MENDVKRILALSRSTRHCHKVVHYGISLARKYGAELTVAHVIHDPFSLEGWNLPIFSLHEEYVKLKEHEQARLHRVIEAERERNLDVTELMPEGDPLTEVLKIIKERNIDLMILRAHDEGRLEHFLFGRTNHELIRRMPCSIFLVRQPVS